MRTPRKRLAVALPVLGLFLVLGACSSPPPPSVAANPCEPNPCLHPNRGQCAVVEGQAVCSCDPGTRLLEGGRCEVPHPCQPNPCTTPNQSVCSVSPEGQAVCACDSGYLPDGQGCRLEPRLTCSGEHTSGDAFEPDECPRLARPFGTQGDQEEAHTLEPASDEDWFRFTASEGRLLEIDARGEPGTELLLSLHSGDGAEVLASELSGQPSVRLLWKAPVTGEFLLRLLASGPEGGAYRLSLANRGVDDFVDTPEEVSSTHSPDGQPVTGALQYGGDRDVLRFSLQAGRSYRFDGAWLASGSTDALRLELLDADGTTVLGSGESISPGVRFLANRTGESFLRVSEPLGTLRGGYVLTALDLGPDDHADTPVGASEVVSQAEPSSGSFERPGDVDVFSFMPQPGHIYTFTCLADGGASDCQVSLSDADGRVLATDHDGGGGSLLHEYTQAGPFFLQLSSPVAGPYTYQLVDLGTDDTGDTRDTATPISLLGADVAGRFETPGDVDVFSFSANAFTTYGFTCQSGGAVDCNLTLLDASGQVLLADTSASSTARLVYVVRTAGTYFVAAEAGTSVLGAYSWRLEDLGPDEHGNVPANATLVGPAASSGQALLQTASDVDVLGFTAEAGHIYEVSCATSEFDCNLVLLGASGAALAADTRPALEARVRYELDAAGPAFFRIQSGDGRAGAYTWKLEDLGVDDHGDVPAEATVLTPSAVAAVGVLETNGDVDVFSFIAEPGHIYEFSCTTLTFDCNLELVDGAGRSVQADLGGGNSARLRYEVPEAGTYSVRVLQGGALHGDYTYLLQHLGRDDHGDTDAEATVLLVSAEPASAVLETVGDVDVFAFTAEPGHTYAFTCSTARFDCAGVVVDAAGNTVATEETGPNLARLTWVAGEAGPYFIRVSQGDWRIGAYEYRLEDLGLVP